MITLITRRDLIGLVRNGSGLSNPSNHKNEKIVLRFTNNYIIYEIWVLKRIVVNPSPELISMVFNLNYIFIQVINQLWRNIPILVKHDSGSIAKKICANS